jgi:carboxylesterase type B
MGFGEYRLFRGDKDKIAVRGESRKTIAISYLLVNPTTRLLFGRAIL